jgi:acetylornithine deacetylase/succinyl-diaminopimelate desuccinylase-like protein
MAELAQRQDPVADLVDRHVDREFVVDKLQALARCPTDVPVGFDTLIDPDDPKLVNYVQSVVRPLLEEVAPDVACTEVGGNLLVRDGDAGTDDALLLQTYTVAQHHNLMEEPFCGSLARRDGQEVVVGQGVSQAKAHQVAMLAVLKLIRDAGVRPARTVWWTVNNEGRSSHACTDALLAAAGELPSAALLLVDSDMRVSVGNRGRIDVDVTVEGTAAHSSTPELARDPIAAVADIVTRLRTLTWDDEDPLLGGRHARVYKVRFEPLTPHTIPARAELTIDRRLLPGDEIEPAVAEIRDCIGSLAPCDVDVRAGVTMLPATTDGDDWVERLQGSIAAIRGGRAEQVAGPGTFDAGGTAARGIPTLMWGAGGAGDWPLGEDFVAVDDVIDEVRVIAHLLLGGR